MKSGIRANAKPAPCSQRSQKPRIPVEGDCVSRTSVDKREVLFACASSLSMLAHLGPARPALADEGYVNMEALKGKDYGKPAMRYPDYELTPEGLQYKDLQVGTGRTLQEGDSCVLDWQGFTVGYYGRVFEARNKAKGGSFEGNDKDFLRIQYGKAQLIPGVQMGLAGMRVGGIRRLIIPETLGYPNADFKNWGPSPETFAGKRTLDFVLKNQGMIDKTLLIDIELLKIA